MMTAAERAEVRRRIDNARRQVVATMERSAQSMADWWEYEAAQCKHAGMERLAATCSRIANSHGDGE